MRKRLAPAFESVGVSYPPEDIVLVGLKEEKRRLDRLVSDLETLPLSIAFPALTRISQAAPVLQLRGSQAQEYSYTSSAG